MDASKYFGNFSKSQMLNLLIFIHKGMVTIVKLKNITAQNIQKTSD